MLTPLNIRVEKTLLKKMDRFIRSKHLDKASFLRQVIQRGFELARQEMVLEQYAKKEISIGAACALLGVNRWEFFDLLKTHHAYLNLDLEDLLNSSRLSDLEAA